MANDEVGEMLAQLVVGFVLEAFDSHFPSVAGQAFDLTGSARDAWASWCDDRGHYADTFDGMTANEFGDRVKWRIVARSAVEAIVERPHCALADCDVIASSSMLSRCGMAGLRPRLLIYSVPPLARYLATAFGLIP